jgi:hypothetical protein
MDIQTKDPLQQLSETNQMHFLYSIYYELTASTCFEHYLITCRRRNTNNNWYFACVLCLLAATRVGVELVTSLRSEVYDV